MVYNPIFEEEISRDQELIELKKAIKLRASKDLLEDVYRKSENFIKSHPIFTSFALAVFGLSLKRKA